MWKDARQRNRAGRERAEQHDRGIAERELDRQVVADTGTSYNNWMTAAVFTGALTDNGTHNLARYISQEFQRIEW